MGLLTQMDGNYYFRGRYYNVIEDFQGKLFALRSPSAFYNRYKNDYLIGASVTFELLNLWESTKKSVVNIPFNWCLFPLWFKYVELKDFKGLNRCFLKIAMGTSGLTRPQCFLRIHSYISLSLLIMQVLFHPITFLKSMQAGAIN